MFEISVLSNTHFGCLMTTKHWKKRLGFKLRFYKKKIAPNSVCGIESDYSFDDSLRLLVNIGKVPQNRPPCRSVNYIVFAKPKKLVENKPLISVSIPRKRLCWWHNYAIRKDIHSSVSQTFLVINWNRRKENSFPRFAISFRFQIRDIIFQERTDTKGVAVS